MNLIQTSRQKDGWDDEAASANERMLKGTLLKCVDGNWSLSKEGTPVKDGLQFVPTGTVAAWVRWSEGKPVQHVFRNERGFLPARESLGDLDEGEWEVGPDGDVQDRWRNTRYVLSYKSRRPRSRRTRSSRAPGAGAPRSRTWPARSPSCVSRTRSRFPSSSSTPRR
jgi:hypothetical protein